MYSENKTSCPFCSADHKTTATINHSACWDDNRFVIKTSFFGKKEYCSDNTTTHVHCECKFCGGKWKVLIEVDNG